MKRDTVTGIVLLACGLALMLASVYIRNITLKELREKAAHDAGDGNSDSVVFSAGMGSSPGGIPDDSDEEGGGGTAEDTP